jgi:hypothetical protein
VDFILYLKLEFKEHFFCKRQTAEENDKGASPFCLAEASVSHSWGEVKFGLLEPFLAKRNGHRTSSLAV